MAILSHPIAWRRESKRDVRADLTAEEQANIRRAIRFLAKRAGTHRKLATTMRTTRQTLVLALGRGTVSAGIALRAARAAKVPLEELLTGSWPKPGACPLCGRE